MNTIQELVGAHPLAVHSPEFLVAGEAYLAAAENDHRGRRRFGPLATVNIVCLAVENLLYGLCMAWGVLPEGSCLHSLSTEAVRSTPLTSPEAARAASLSGLLDVCSLLPETSFDDLRPADAEQALRWGIELSSPSSAPLPAASRSVLTRSPQEALPCPTSA